MSRRTSVTVEFIVDNRLIWAERQTFAGARRLDEHSGIQVKTGEIIRDDRTFNVKLVLRIELCENIFRLRTPVKSTTRLFRRMTNADPSVINVDCESSESGFLRV
jgi:hypothetical protein